MNLINKLELVATLHVKVIAPLSQWQLSYAAKGDNNGVERIEEMLSILNEIGMTLSADISRHGVEQMQVRAWQERYLNDMQDAEAKIRELQGVISSEEYFITRTKNDGVQKGHR